MLNVGCRLIDRPVNLIIEVFLEYLLSLLLLKLYLLSFFLFPRLFVPFFFFPSGRFLLPEPFTLSSEIVHVFILQANILVASGAFLSLGAAIVRMFLVIFEFHDLLAELAGLRPE